MNQYENARPTKPHFTTAGFPNVVDARYVEKMDAIAIEGWSGPLTMVALHLPIAHAEALYRQLGDALAASHMARPRKAA